MRTLCIILSVLITIVACKEDEQQVIKPEAVYDVPAMFQPVIDSFIVEGLKRGQKYARTNLIIRYENDFDTPVCGRSNVTTRDSSVVRIISINAALSCWTNKQELENLIFHELGHCFLGRSHKNTLLPNGDSKSIMVSDSHSLYSPCIYQIDDTPCNNLFKRKYYLDELFEETTPIPDWGK